MSSTTKAPEPTFLQELRFFTKTLPQQYRTYQPVEVKKVKASLIEKEIQKNRKLVGSKSQSTPMEKTQEDIENEQELKVEQEEVRARKQKAKQNGSAASRGPKKISKAPRKQKPENGHKNDRIGNRPNKFKPRPKK
jgi:hypothetical protein